MEAISNDVAMHLQLTRLPPAYPQLTPNHPGSPQLAGPREPRRYHLQIASGPAFDLREEPWCAVGHGKFTAGWLSWWPNGGWDTKGEMHSTGGSNFLWTSTLSGEQLAAPEAQSSGSLAFPRITARRAHVPCYSSSDEGASSCLGSGLRWSGRTRPPIASPTDG